MTLGRHLLPQEFDLLLDEEVGFGVPPLLGHVRECSQCANELAAARAAVEALERVPRFRPSPLFAERVMLRVHMFRPWHAAAMELARRLVPRPGPLRTAVTIGGGVALVTLTGLGLWAATRMNSFLFLLGVLTEQLRRIAIDAVDTLFGGAAAAALEAGDPRSLTLVAVALTLSAILGIAGIAAAGRAVRARSR